jgi:hypothetical protein
MLTIADLAWTAGIIDGEGSVFVMKQKRKDRERDTNYILRVSVQSTDPYMTKELFKMFPEGAEFSVQRERGFGWSDTLKWQLNGKKAARFLKEVLPYIRVKQDQIKLALEFQETTKKHWRHMLPEDYEKQAQLYLALKQAKIDLKIGQEHNITKES